MKKVKVAVIGCGTIANSAHLPSYSRNPKAELAYVCDIIPERAEAAKAAYGAGKAVLDYKEILADPTVEAISLCVPNFLHDKIAIDCLNAGKNVLCEKPAAVSYERACAMKEAADRNGKILNIGVVNRFKQSVNKVKKLIDDGDLGQLYHVYCSFRSHRSIPGLGGPFTRLDCAGGGVLIDWGVHFLDLIFYCIGDVKPVSASGEAYSKLGQDMENYTYTSMWAGPPDFNGKYEVEDFVTGFIRTSGASITLNGAWAQNIGEDAMFIEFLGDKGGIKLQYGGNFVYYTAKDGSLLETKYDFNPGDMFYDELDAFLDSASSNTKIRSNIDNVLITTNVMEALYQSAAQKKEIVF
jgi:predicted dehydrogenase